MVPEFFTVSDAARELERRYRCVVRPRSISALLYNRVLNDELCPIVGRRRLISRSALEEIERALLQRGEIQLCVPEEPPNG